MIHDFKSLSSLVFGNIIKDPWFLNYAFFIIQLAYFYQHFISVFSSSPNYLQNLPQIVLIVIIRIKLIQFFFFNQIWIKGTFFTPDLVLFTNKCFSFKINFLNFFYTKWGFLINLVNLTLVLPNYIIEL